MTEKRPGGYHIGDVCITTADVTNPYNGRSLYGDVRREALHQFKRGELPKSYKAWYAPSFGGARILTDPSEVDWSGLRPLKGKR